MKGKSIYTKREVEQIMSLIRKRCSAGRNEQKQIRAKMRRIGFYGQDDFGIFDMTEESLSNLLNLE